MLDVFYLKLHSAQGSPASHASPFLCLTHSRLFPLHSLFLWATYPNFLLESSVPWLSFPHLSSSVTHIDNSF